MVEMLCIDTSTSQTQQTSTYIILTYVRLYNRIILLQPDPNMFMYFMMVWYYSDYY